MKAVQVMFDESLLAQLDSDAEVQQRGRSAVLREAVAAYLERRRRARIAEQYRRAYADGEGLGEEFESWEEQGVWPPLAAAVHWQPRETEAGGTLSHARHCRGM